MSILPQDKDGQELFNAISTFFSTFRIGNLLHKCNAQKEKGVPVIDIFKYKLCNVFADRSMYMQQKTGSFKESFSKNTFYRFLNSPKTNWLRFTTLLSKKIADAVEPLTSEDRVNAFVVDDSLFERTSCKQTELGSRVFDHTSMKYCKGFRLMTLGWTDGNTFLPVNSCLLASSKEKNLIGPVDQCDGRSLAAKRRKLAQTKGTEVMIELLKTAQNAGHHADYVLFDTWFSSPAQLIAVKKLGLDSIAMLKKSSHIYYEYEGKQLSIKKIFGICKKRRGRSKYLLSVNVMVGKDEKIPAKIVCVRNKKNKKDWIAFICTNPELSEEEIIRIYGKRWQIEVFFKTCKSYLQLISECHSLSYDALTAHVAIVFTRYLMISMEQRRSKDDRTLGEIFYFFTDELADITFGESFQIIITAMIESISAIFQPTEEQLAMFIEMFVGQLPEYIRNSLAKAGLAA
ncbi:MULTISPECIES: IS4 family transposase [unclassified Bilifractor]|uniref:IS4 family transposase n=1 Tax=unclassified Bilifractor TaxID=2815795 RepID=UPI003F93BAA1